MRNRSNELPGFNSLMSEAQKLFMSILSADATTADADAVKRWCEQSPAHADAFAEVKRLWYLLESAAQLARSRKGELHTPEELASRAPWLGRRAMLATGLAAVPVGAAVLWPPFGLWPSLTEMTAQYRTGTGQQRRVLTANGVSIELNTQTSLNVGSATKTGGRIELISGEAAITTNGEPLIMTAADGQTSATTAKFNVKYADRAVSVTCIDGRVSVGCRGRTSIVQKNMQVVYDDRGLQPVRAIDVTVVTAWRSGSLIFHNVPLFEVVQEVNRYRPGKIFLVNDAIGRQLVYASFSLSHLDAVIRVIQEVYDAKVTTLPGGIVLLS